MNEESPKQSTAVQKSWDAFRACVEDNRVRPDRSRQDIEAFLADLFMGVIHGVRRQFEPPTESI